MAAATPFAPLPPAKPAGPPAPALLPRNVPSTTLPPLVAETSSVPAIVTLAVARSVTGVFAALRVKRTMTPDGMLMVVKLKTPFAGSVSVVLVVGVKATSAPLLPLLIVCASAGAVSELAQTGGRGGEERWVDVD